MSEDDHANGVATTPVQRLAAQIGTSWDLIAQIDAMALTVEKAGVAEGRLSRLNSDASDRFRAASDFLTTVEPECRLDVLLLVSFSRAQLDAIVTEDPHDAKVLRGVDRVLAGIESYLGKATRMKLEDFNAGLHAAWGGGAGEDVTSKLQALKMEIA